MHKELSIFPHTANANKISLKSTLLPKQLAQAERSTSCRIHHRAKPLRPRIEKFIANSPLTVQVFADCAKTTYRVRCKPTLQNRRLSTRTTSHWAWKHNFGRSIDLPDLAFSVYVELTLAVLPSFGRERRVLR